MYNIEIKRAYDAPQDSDGYRVLVDRLWPRGEKKDVFEYDLWAKEIAPSTELREWFHQDEIGRWNDFYNKYVAELNESSYTKAFINQLKEHHTITLLYSAKDKTLNNAVVLQHYLKKILL